MGEEKNDLTAIENLGVFEHQEDDQINQQLSTFSSDEKDSLPPLPMESESEEEESPPDLNFTVVDELPPEFQTTATEDEVTPTIEEAVQEEETPPSFPSIESTLTEEHIPLPDEIPSWEGPSTLTPPSPTWLEEEKQSTPLMAEEQMLPHPRSQIEEIRSFAEQIGTTQLPDSGGPFFTVVAQNIRYKEEAEEILTILKNHHLLPDEKLAEESLAKGHIIIPQLNEFAAIYILHQLRRFNLQLKMGLAEEINPSPHYTTAIPPVTRNHLKQNRVESHTFDTPEKKIEEIIVTSTPYIMQCEIAKYLGIVNETMIISEEELITGEALPPFEESDKNLANYFPKLKDKYQLLSSKLKELAYKMGGDAIIGVHYQLTPLILDEQREETRRYQLQCIGSVVKIA